MKLKIKEYTEKEIEVKNPSYYINHTTFTRITNKGVYKVYKDSIFFTASTDNFYTSEVLQAMKGKEVSDIDFLNAWDNTISKLSELLVL